MIFSGFHVIIYDMKWLLHLSGERLSLLEQYDDNGHRTRSLTDALTVQDVCERIKKSRRQVYRDMRLGKITALGKFIGEWLFDPEEVERFKKRTPPPRFLKPFFWEHSIDALDIHTQKKWILERLLEKGDLNAIRWAYNEYGPKQIQEVARTSRSLSPKTFNFWTRIMA